MPHTNNTIGKALTILQLVSASATNPSTFVLREVQELRRMGLGVVIAQLRPFYKRMSTSGFDELTPSVISPDWLSPILVLAILYYAAREPRRLWSYFSQIFRGDLHLSNLAKMLYVLLASLKFAFKCRAYKSAHIRAHFLHSEALAAYFMSGLLHIPYSITVHTVVVHFPENIMREVARNAAFVVADTMQVHQFLELLQVPIGQIRLIRNGLPLHELAFQPDRTPADQPILLAAGYLVPKKGFDVLLSACGILHERGVRFRCVIVGDGAERRNLEALTEKLRLQDDVRMLGDVPFHELKQWYYQAALFVMPSVTLPDGATDGLPTVVLESLACGTPVVGTSVAAIPEVIVHGRTGFLVPPNAPEAMANQIESLLEQQALGSAMALEGRRLIEKEFDVRRNSEVLANLILSGSNSLHSLSFN